MADKGIAVANKSWRYKEITITAKDAKMLQAFLIKLMLADIRLRMGEAETETQSRLAFATDKDYFAVLGLIQELYS